jgi:protein TonB
MKVQTHPAQMRLDDGKVHRRWIMFEHSLVESRGLTVSKGRTWTALGSLVLQCAVGATLIVVPMLRPELLTITTAPPTITVPNLKPIEMVQQLAQTATTAVALSAPVSNPVVERTRGFILTDHHADIADAQPTGIATMTISDANSLAPLAAIRNGAVSTMPARAPEARPLRVSSGVSTGLLLSPITPVYPAIARATGVHGSVVIEAVISKTGHVESLNVVSGPDLLRRPALDAVRSARYAPYRLNGEPVEVQTVITLVFRVGSPRSAVCVRHEWLDVFAR